MNDGNPKKGLWSGLSGVTKAGIVLGVLAFVASWIPPLLYPPSHQLEPKPTETTESLERHLQEALDAMAKDLDLLVFASTFAAFLILVLLQIEMLHKLGKLEERTDEEHEVRESIRHQLAQIRAELPRMKVCGAMNETFQDAEARKSRHARLSNVVDAFVQHNLNGMQGVLRANGDFDFDLEGVTDGGSKVWEAFIKSAHRSFFGVQYWYTPQSLGASRATDALGFQKARIKELAPARASFVPTARTANEYFTRVFVVDDGKNTGANKLETTWFAMKAQADAGITVRFILASEYSRLTAASCKSMGSPDFCIIDRRIHGGTGSARTPTEDLGPCLMVVKYTKDALNPRKVGFQITVDPEKLAAAQTAIDCLLGTEEGKAGEKAKEGHQCVSHLFDEKRTTLDYLVKLAGFHAPLQNRKPEAN